jgi:hypothetical protein
VFSGSVAGAVSAVVAVRQDILAFNRERAENEGTQVELYAAIDQGEVMMGVVGDEGRLAPAAVATCLDSARYLADLAQRLDAGILCTTEIAHEAEAYSQRYIGKCAGKDIRAGGQRVYEIFDGDALETRAVKEKTRAQFAEGVYGLYARDFSGAKRIFMDIIRLNTSDGVSRFYLFLADRLEKSGGGTTEEALYLA